MTDRLCGRRRRLQRLPDVGMMESTLDVRVAAVSGVLIAAAFVLMLSMEWTVGLTRRMRD